MLKNIEGKKVPAVKFIMRANNEWTSRHSDEIFANKTVILFSLPGAFTPTCSSAHLPRYNELAKTFSANGVDEIICLSVNDAFVMNAWAVAQQSENVSLLPDGNGEFTQQMGMLVDKSDLGFGKRSWRYSMLVKNGVIEKMFIEEQVPGDPFELSDADTMLAYINPKAVQTKVVTIFSTPSCPYCQKAKALLASQGLKFEDLSVGTDVNTSVLKGLTNSSTVPQIFIDGKHIGGSDDLAKYFA